MIRCGGFLGVMLRILNLRADCKTTYTTVPGALLIV